MRTLLFIAYIRDILHYSFLMSSEIFCFNRVNTYNTSLTKLRVKGFLSCALTFLL